MRIIKSISAIIALLILSSVAMAEEIGEEHEENIFNLRTGHGWDGPPNCKPHSGGDSRGYSPPSGYVLISQRWVSNTNHNGWTRIDVGEGGPAFPSVTSINNQFYLLSALARATKNTEAAREIDAIKNKWINARANVTQKNTLVGTVWAGADGNCGDRKDGWQDSNFYATIRRVGNEEELSTVVGGLKRKYFPDV